MVNTLEVEVGKSGIPSVLQGHHYPTDQEFQVMSPGERDAARRWIPGQSIFMNMDPVVVASYATTAGAPHEVAQKAKPAQRDLPYNPKSGR